MDQSDIDAYAERLAPTLSVEAHAMLTVASLIGMQKINRGEIQNVEEALVGGVLVIHGNSLVAAHYREISDKPFERDTYFIFPVFKSQLQETIQKLAGKNANVQFPEYEKNKLYACVFYGSGYSIVQIPEDKTPEGMSKLANLIGEKLASLPDGAELMEIFSNLFGGRK